MGLMTKDEYIESLRKLKPTVYMFGEKVENVGGQPAAAGRDRGHGGDI